MNESSRTIDARSQACPGPVILLKKALEAGTAGLIDIIVDNEAARENVTRFAGKKGCAIVASTGAAPEILVTVSTSAARGAEAGEAASIRAVAPVKASPSRAVDLPLVVLIESDRMGNGNDELGALLVRGFLYALAERDEQPDAVILMNHGVLLAIEGSDSLGNLRRLADMGVELLACGTCLEFLGVKNRLAAGRVSNMYEIADKLCTARVLSI